MDSPETADTRRASVFEEQRPRLFGLAYRLLGSATDAQDIVQSAYLSWHDADWVETPGAWLSKVVTNLCLNQLTSGRARRETYPGPWLPEPVLTETGVLGPLETVEQRESVSMAFLLLLERLTPTERAVFVLRAAFDHSHAEIAGILDIDVAHSRQLYHRARAHLADRRKRFPADDSRHRRMVTEFLAAATSGNATSLHRLLADDVVAWIDGGGATAARRPILGRDRVLRYLIGMTHRPETSRITLDTAMVNGELSILAFDGDRLAAVITVELTGSRIVAVRMIVAEPKLAFAAATVDQIFADAPHDTN
ncbi:sigma-70 family RNA polymerase sigma factor [Nocardia cyriacigeorgica]|uniref:Sigma-70 family RNA polymerase sigma factor n=1 Tax=Nocardia cyriacigeorgica TaxID=135487 RepID=A0A5R8PF16_9NOCA|nr:RNA polymerase sigma factor SigJ [Nocardia cyriacigeorgica]TLG12107.1 sigma-70 family RNA polymerase sigma factor [Nocardia cyriacigeorgica]